MFDFVSAALVLILPVLWYSVYLVKIKKKLELHKRIQIYLGGILLVTVLLFEVDIRLNDWRPLAISSPYFKTILFPFLYMHLIFAISTSIVWIWTIVGALRNFPKTLSSNLSYAPSHHRLGWISFVLLNLTALTGWIFYYLAFVASTQGV